MRVRDRLAEFLKINAIRRMLAMLVMTRREASILVGLSLLYALFEGVGISLLLPILQYVEGGGDANTLAGGGYIWELLIAFTDWLSVPLNLLTLLVLAFMPILMRQVVFYASSLYTVQTQLRAVERLRHRAFAAMMDADLSYHQAHGLGRHVSFVLTQTGQSGQSVIHFAKILVAGILILMYSALLLVLSVPLTIIALATAGVITLAMRSSLARTREYGKRLTALNNVLNVSVQERLSGIRLIKMLGQEEVETANVDRIVLDQQENQYGVARVKAIVEAVIDPSLMLAAFVIVYAGVEAFGMTLAGLGLFLFILLRLNAKAKEFNVGRQSLAGTIESLLFVHNVEAEARASRTITGGDRPYEGLLEGIDLKDVGYVYAGAEGEPVLTDVSLSIPKGSSVALVGKSGAGKSTLVDLIPHLKEPTSGQVLIDGVDIKELDLRSLRRGIGFMTQDAMLFNDTLRNNILYGIERPVSDGEIEAALQGSYSLEFVRQLPKGLETIVGERGTRLSGGQRQRVMLARVLLQDPDILILDEPTSALDSESEAYIQQALRDLHGRTTLIVIAHRLSTVENADQILVLDRGRVVERGTHGELVTRDGPYKRLFDLQIHA